MTQSSLSVSDVWRIPRLAFNADEADCCTCIVDCDARLDGICRCLPMKHAMALPLAITNANRCVHKRANGHRCALAVAHASEHFYREDGVPWRGESR